MKHSILLYLSLLLVFSACKEQVNFSSAEDRPRDFSEPGEPVEPTDPVGNGPSVKIVQGPQDHRYGKGTQVVFKVEPGDHEIESVECYIDQFEINCDWLKGLVKLVKMPLGQHLFQVVATDVEGLKDEAEESWRVLDRYRSATENLDVRQGMNSTDILFVIDNSSSMRYEQSQISQRFSNFMSQIKDIDWQIGIITTAVSIQREWSDGRLVPLQRNQYILKKSMGQAKAQEIFAEAVQRKESGRDTEEGIKATYRAVERAVRGKSSDDKRLKKFFRPNAALAVVVVSDEDEARKEFKNKGRNLVNFIKDKWGSQKVFQFNSIVVHTQKCLNGTGAQMGRAYEALSRLTNGIVGDVCAEDYSSLLSDLGKGVAELKRVHNLKCLPQDVDNDGKVDLLITGKKGQKVPGYTVDKNQITFDQALDVGKYKFDYYCLID